MIPILFEKTETAFTSSGIGRLVDCIECKVTEELNTGVYECDFQYPVTGEMYSEITLGRIVGVTHDDTGDLQPFDIVSCSRPIDGVVSFHATHISYRLARVITYPSKAGGVVDSVMDALSLFMTGSPVTSFTFSAPGMGSLTGLMALTEEDIPRSIRQFIGDGKGSFLGTYGGEVKWDKFDVIFTTSRGQARDFTIRYGVNMMGYNEEQDGQETYTLAIPFWKGQGNLVVGGLVDSGLTPYDRPLCVALDLTDKFETEPTAAQLEAEALSIMTSSQPNLPRRSIEVDFIRLQDLEDYGDYSDLATCELGDSISAVFPMYNITGTFRIVKVIWDVLRDRFDTMTLGSLQTTLAEALGVGGGMTNVGGGGGGGGSVVSFTQVLPSGTKIGIITIDGTSTDIYAPAGGGGGDTVTWNQILQTGTKIAELGINGNTTDVYAPAVTAGDRNTFYGTSSTAAATANKDVICSDWLDNYGDIIAVTFTNANTAQQPQLAVNGGTARPIILNGNTQGATWEAGETVTFMRRQYGGGTPCFEFLAKSTASVPDATTSAKGVVMLSTATNSSDTDKAATPSAVKAAYDLADAKSTAVSTSIILGSQSWRDIGGGVYAQTAICSEVSANSIVIVSPAPNYRDYWIASDVFCYYQQAGALGFKCGKTPIPTNNIEVNVLVID